MGSFEISLFKIVFFGSFLLGIAVALQTSLPESEESKESETVEDKTSSAEPKEKVDLSEVPDLLKNNTESEESKENTGENVKEDAEYINKEIVSLFGGKTHEEEVIQKETTEVPTESKENGEESKDTKENEIKESPKEEPNTMELKVVIETIGEEPKVVTDTIVEPRLDTKNEESKVEEETKVEESKVEEVSKEENSVDETDDNQKKPEITELPEETVHALNSTPTALQATSLDHPAFSPKVSAAILATVCVGIAAFGYIGLLVWRKILERRYGNSEMLIPEEEFYDVSDLRNFDI